jgi:hypothetical protein
MRALTPRIFAIDARSLAALRIGLGALLLADLAYRTLDLEAHYADMGVLPRGALRAVLHDPAGMWSLHELSGAWQAHAALFVLAALAAVALLVGYRARLAAAVSWLLLVSIHHRNPFLITGADQVLRLLLFWSLFLPIDARFAVRRRRPVPDASVCSPASAALLIQVALLYAMSVLFKLRTDEWLSLTAIRESFAVEGVATDFARWLLQYPDLLTVAAAATLAIESLAVVLPFVPWRSDALRIAIAGAAVGLHVFGVGTTMRLGLMPAVLAFAWVPFLPGVLWEKLGARERSAAGPPPARQLAGADAVALLALALVVAENADSTLRSRGGAGLPPPLPTVVEALGLSQQWRLWDRPIPNRYYVFAATLRNGSEVDLHTGGPLDWDHPRRRSANNHWWKYHLHLARPHGIALRPWYARHLALRWNREHGPERAVDRLDLVRIHATGRAESPARFPREVLWRGKPPLD